MDPILRTAKKHNLVVIEDAAQAIGAEDRGRRAGSTGQYGCLSFFPTKNIGGFGDGGMVLTNDERRLEKLRALRTHGTCTKDGYSMVGGNFRLDALQAAVVTVKLKYLDQWVAKRNENAHHYNRLFEAAGLVQNTITAPTAVQSRHAFHQYVVRAKNRDGLASFLRKNGVGCEIFYPRPLHLEACFASLGYNRGDFPESEKAARETLAIPIYPELSKEQIEFVVRTVSDFYK